jgi:hypothetical protein
MDVNQAVGHHVAWEVVGKRGAVREFSDIHVEE